MLRYVPGEQGSTPPRAFFSFSCFYGSVTETWVAHHQFIVLSPIKGAWRNNLSGPNTIILKTVRGIRCKYTAFGRLTHGYYVIAYALLFMQ